jgi:DNA-binding transcriptional MerR regulator
MSNTRQLLNSRQAAEHLGVHKRTVSRYVKSGDLPPAEIVDGGNRDRVLAFLFDMRDVELTKLRRAQRREAS